MDGLTAFTLIHCSTQIVITQRGPCAEETVISWCYLQNVNIRWCNFTTMCNYDLFSFCVKDGKQMWLLEIRVHSVAVTSWPLQLLEQLKLTFFSNLKEAMEISGDSQSQSVADKASKSTMKASWRTKRRTIICIKSTVILFTAKSVITKGPD